MNKGTAIVGFFMCFLAGMFLMWGMNKQPGSDISAEGDSAAIDQSDSPIPVSAKDPSWGNPDALVTIVEFSDFECPFCSRVEPTMDKIKEKYGKEQVRVVWKNAPLPFHKAARPAAEAAQTVFALGGSEAFWKFHATAFKNAKQLTEDNFVKWATAAGVDGAKFKQAFASKQHGAKVDEDQALAKKVGANGTPAFRINGVTLSGAQPVDKFEEVIDEQIAEAKKLIASGTKKSQVYAALTKKNFKAAPEDDKGKKGKEAPEEDDKSVWKVPVFSDDPIRGAKDALVTMVVFSEFQCPFCKRVEDTLSKLSSEYKNDLRIVWKDNPLPFHPRAKPAAALARTAFDQKGNDGFWKAHDDLFASQPKLEDADLKGIGDKLGISFAAVQASLDAKKFDDKFEQSMTLATDFQARGTPHFFINGVRLAGAQPAEKFKEVIDAQMKIAKDLVAKGTPRAKVYEEVLKNAKEPGGMEKKEVAAPDDTCASKGPKNAKVVIQEFSEFQCPFCKKVGPSMKQVEEEFGDKVRIVWRHMPLSFHKQAPLAAEASQEVFTQKGSKAFWEYHDKLFEAQGSEGALERENLEKIAQGMGVDMAKFRAALDNRTHKAKIDKDAAVGAAAGINGTPGFSINGYMVSGAQPFAEFKKVITLALKEAK
jgi:protein-disulfide isomerase